MKILPIKRYLIPRPGKGIEYREICKEFKPREDLKCKEIEAKCIFCQNGEFHTGFECIDRRAGCVCLAGCDPRNNGEYKANLRDNKKQEGGSRT